MSKKIPFVLFLIVLLLVFVNRASAQSKFKAQYVIFSEDNDSINLRGKGTDRFYTNGTRISMFYTKPERRRFITSLLIPLSNGSDNL